MVESSLKYVPTLSGHIMLIFCTNLLTLAINAHL